MRIQVSGAEGLRAAATRSRRFAASGVLQRLTEEAFTGMVPEAEKAVQGGAQRLPASGGLAKRVARTQVTGRASRNGDGVTMRLMAQKNALRDPGAINRGRARHPTYGHKPMVIQLVPRGFFSEPLTDMQPEIRRRLREVKREAIRTF